MSPSAEFGDSIKVVIERAEIEIMDQKPSELDEIVTKEDEADVQAC